MAKVLIPEDVQNFIASLGGYEVDVYADLFLLQSVDPDELESCEHRGDGIWEYRLQIAPSRYAYLLFAHFANIDHYVVLHGFRAGIEGATRSDLQYARRRRKGH